MAFDDRFIAFLLGISAGFLLGYLTAWVRTITAKLDKIKEELDEVDEIMKEYHPDWRVRLRRRDERGILNSRLGMNLVVALLVALTAISAIRAQAAVNDVKDTQAQQEALTACTASMLTETIQTLDVRSNATREQVKANVDLQRAQSEMVSVLLHQPPYTEARRVAAFKAYFDSLNQFVSAADNVEDKAISLPYPTVEQFNACIEKETKGD